MITSIPVPVETERLVLRRFVPADFVAYADYHSRPEVYRFLYAEAPSGDALRTQFDTVISAPFSKDGDVLRLAVTRRDDDVLLGEVLLKIASREALQAEVGYIFSPVHAGKGYATEAVRTIIDIGFATFGYHRIFARLDAKNQGSIGVVERLKMRKEALLIQNDRFNGVWGDEFIYAILKSEWNELKSR